MLELDEIFYAALTADTTIAEACGYVAQTQSTPGKPARIYSTCVEVPPTEKDNTSLTYIIIMDEGLQNEKTTKDDVWDSEDDRVQASVQISAKSPKEVKRLTRLCRKAIADYIATMEGDKPYLQSLTTDGTAWDWTKPCYYKTLTYQCDVTNTNDDEQD
jgi:hypothetical protein